MPGLFSNLRKNLGIFKYKTIMKVIIKFKTIPAIVGATRLMNGAPIYKGFLAALP
jgi:hypothetical protein